MARSRNHSCRGKATSITYPECVSVALIIQHAKRMRRITRHLWPVWLYHVFPHYFIMTRFSEKIFYRIQNVGFHFLHTVI